MPQADQSSVPSRPTWVRWRILALLLAFSFMSWFNRTSLSVAADMKIMREYQLSEKQMGLVYSSLILGYALFMIAGGWFADRKGAWLALVIVGVGAGSLVMSMGIVQPTFGYMLISLLLIRFATGVFYAPIYPSSGRIISHWMPFGLRAWSNGMVMSAALLGMAVMPVVFGALIDSIQWRQSFVITGAITIGIGLLWTVYAKENPFQHHGVNSAELKVIRPDDPAIIQQHGTQEQVPDSLSANITTPPGAEWLDLLRSRSLILLTLSYAAVGYFEYLFYFWTHYYFVEVLKLDESVGRRYTSILFLAAAGGIFLGGVVSDWLGRRFGYYVGRVTVPIGGMVASAVLLGLGLYVTDPLWILVCFATALASVAASEGPFWATAIDLGGKQGGASAGIFNLGGNVGGFLAPIVTPWVSSELGWQYGIALSGVFCLIGVLLWIWIDPRERPQNSEAL